MKKVRYAFPFKDTLEVGMVRQSATSYKISITQGTLKAFGAII